MYKKKKEKKRRQVLRGYKGVAHRRAMFRATSILKPNIIETIDGKKLLVKTVVVNGRVKYDIKLITGENPYPSDDEESTDDNKQKRNKSSKSGEGAN